MTSLVQSDYQLMKGNLLSAVELHRLIMVRKLEDRYRDLSASEKHDYDNRVQALMEHVDHLDKDFETEFWTLLNLGTNQYGIDWGEATIANVDARPTDDSSFHQPVQQLNIRVAHRDSTFLIRIPMIIRTQYGWRILSTRMEIEEVEAAQSQGETKEMI